MGWYRAHPLGWGALLPGSRWATLGGLVASPSLPDADERARLFFRDCAPGLRSSGGLDGRPIIAAQFIDVRLFHFWKALQRGRALVVRNNGSTLVAVSW